MNENHQLLGIPIGEMFDTPVEDIHWENTTDRKRCVFKINTSTYVCDIELRNIAQLKLSFANVSFGLLTKNGDVDQQLQHWKESPYAVLSGVRQCLIQGLMPLLNTLDAVVFIASDKNKEVSKRMRLYKSFASYFDKSFRFHGDHTFDDGSQIHIMHSIENGDKRNQLMKFIEQLTK